MTEAQPGPANKAELLDDVKKRWNAFVVYVDSLPREQWTAPADPAGWTVSDHVTHATAWASGMDVINEEVRQRTMGRSIGTVKSERDATFAALLKHVSGFSDDDLERPGGEFGLEEGETCLREVLVGYLGGHYDEHRKHMATIVEG
jgi:hypothetical protein